jgi:hypothetical protein
MSNKEQIGKAIEILKIRTKTLKDGDPDKKILLDVLQKMTEKYLKEN